ncbi:hypothetical protein RhiirA4_471209 [Rhizophagus irregularis]|uniref:Uncharacterized protein n=1 Tax=Rhizophagus irregularis TaxID=588596 RepID=A0A2I1H2P9_9GLOM|nr:hypothetical protein RhiirA4_471209 [Rhizophagus irregularis]
MFIPEKYRDIIPKDPIYVNNRFIIPGSCEWFTYMYNLEKSIREQRDLEYDKWFHGETARIQQNMADNQARWAHVKHFHVHKERIKSLTDSTNDFHNYISDHLKKKSEIKGPGPSRRRLNGNLKNFSKKHNLRHQSNFFDATYEPLEVSDDTAILQLRPNKRDINNNRNGLSLHIDTPSKCSRPAPTDESDSSEAGPSNSK